jgi:hypothetical protein
VTARHNVERAKDEGKVILRFNMKDGTSLVVDATTANWFMPEDAAVDVALLRYDVSLEEESCSCRLRSS